MKQIYLNLHQKSKLPCPHILLLINRKQNQLVLSFTMWTRAWEKCVSPLSTLPRTASARPPPAEIFLSTVRVCAVDRLRWQMENEGQGKGAFPLPQTRLVKHREGAWPGALVCFGSRGCVFWAGCVLGHGAGGQQRGGPCRRVREARAVTCDTEGDKTRKDSSCRWHERVQILCWDFDIVLDMGEVPAKWESVAFSLQGTESWRERGHWRAHSRHTCGWEDYRYEADLQLLQLTVQTLSWVLQRFSISRCLVASGESFHWLSLFFKSSTVLKPKTNSQMQEDTGSILSVRFDHFVDSQIHVSPLILASLKSEYLLSWTGRNFLSYWFLK